MGADKFFSGGIFHGKIFQRGGKIAGSVYFRENITLGKFTGIPIRNSSYAMLSLFRLNFMLGDFKGIAQRKFSPGLNCPEDISIARRYFFV